MTRIRKAISKLVGGIQCMLGGLASALVFLVYADPSIRELLAATSKEVPLYMFFFSVFGTFSILSGLLLVREEDSGS